MGGGENGPDERLTLRQATMDDIDDIVHVYMAGRAEDPEFDYRLAYRDKYPEDTLEWIRREWTEYLTQPTKYVIVLATASDYNDKPVAISIWDYNVAEADQGTDLGVSDDPDGPVRRRDVDPKKYRAWKEQLTAGFIKFLINNYGMEHWFLWVLCTLPEFRRRGAATRLCKWGLERIAQEGKVGTVMVTDPKCIKFYENLGWRHEGQFTIRAGDEPESMEVWAMSHKP